MVIKNEGAVVSGKIVYSIVMTAFNRNSQLLATLQSFNLRGYAGNLEVIIVDDASKEPVRIDVDDYKFKIQVITSNADDKWYSNPCIPFNSGLRKASGDVVIIQNAECYHKTDILNYLDKNYSRLSDEYFSFSCYSVDEVTTQKKEFEDFNNFLESAPKFDGDNGWYNHSIHRPVGYHFCSAIRRDKLKEVGLFDETYANGIGYDDDELLFRIKKCLKLIIVDDCLVLHQWHYTGGQRNQKLLLRNRLLYKLYTKRKFSSRFVLSFCLPIYLILLKLRDVFR